MGERLTKIETIRAALLSTVSTVEGYTGPRVWWHDKVSGALVDLDDLEARLAAVETERDKLHGFWCAASLRQEQAEAERDEARQALRQACMNLGTIRPLDMLREGENDISIGEAADRWRDLVIEQSALPVAARPEGDSEVPPKD